MNRVERVLKSILFVILNIIDIYIILISVAIWIPPDYMPQGYIIETPVLYGTLFSLSIHRYSIIIGHTKKVFCHITK